MVLLLTTLHRKGMESERERELVRCMQQTGSCVCVSVCACAHMRACVCVRSDDTCQNNPLALETLVQ